MRRLHDRATIVGRVENQLRRRSVGAPAAPSALLTLLGEYIAPENRAFYRDGVVAVLETLGYRTPAARQALARSVTGGWLESERVGRRSRMKLTEPTRAMLRAGYPRIYGFGEPWRWDGRWLVVVIRVPEERRQVRDRLRTQLTWAGFGSLGGGLWISPHIDRERELIASVNGDRDRNGADEAADLLTFTGELGTARSPADVIAQAWELADIAERYHQFLEDFRSLSPKQPAEVLCAQVAMVHAWRKFPFVDPDLPEELLPEHWPRDEARTLFHNCHARWASTAQDYFRSLTD